MAIGVRMEPELERRLNQLARRKSELLAEREPPQHWSEQLPDWSDWTA